MDAFRWYVAGIASGCAIIAILIWLGFHPGATEDRGLAAFILSVGAASLILAASRKAAP